MSNCKIFRNNDGSINKVFDEFGNESQLYQDTLFHVSTLVDNIPMTPPVKHYLDKGDIMDTSVSEIALGLWAYSYSDHFRNKYNIIKSNLEEVSVDDIIRHINEYYPKPVVQETTTVEQPAIKEGLIEPTDKIIWGHPAIGKSYAAKKVKMIDFDSYKLGINKKYNLYIAPGLSDTELRTDDKTREARENWRYEKSENAELWNQFIRNTWQQAKKDAKEQGAILFASDLLVLREFGNEVDKALTMPDELFFERSKQRNNFIEGELGTKVWKGNLNKAINDFKEEFGENKVINTEKYLSDLFIEDNQNIKEGVEDLFNANPELSTIGTQEQYSQYLDTVFPDSKVKDIVYHGSDTMFDGFLEDNLNYFGTQAIAKGYGKNLYPTIIEINKPYYEDGGNLSNQSYEDLYDKLDESGSDGFISNGKNLFVPKTEEQIHILGNKEDIEGFKKFVSSNVIPEQRLTDEKIKPTNNFIQLIKNKLDGSKLSQEIEGKLEANKDRLIDLLGSSMYSEKLKDVVYKELLQNSFDAVKIAESKGLIDKGKIDIVINEKERIISFTDNGIGMTSDIVQKAFFTIGGTYKGDDVDNKLKSGGLGLAKMAFIFGSEKLNLETIHNGIKTTVDATSQEIRTDNFKIKTESTNKKNGTIVSVKIPKTYIDAKGEERNIDFPSYLESEFEYSFLSNPLIGNVDVNYSIINRTSSYRKDEEIKTNLGSIPEGFILFSPAKTSFADMDIYIDTNNITRGGYSSTKHKILSSGLYQFNTSFKKDNDEVIPLNIIIDIKPKVDATNSQYPFNNQRENFKPTIKNDIGALNKYLGLLWNSIEIELLKNSFSKIKNIESIDVENVDNTIIEKNKEITKEFKSLSNSDIIKSAIEDFNKINEEAFIEAGGLKTKEFSLSKEDIDKDKEKSYNQTFKAEKEITINKETGLKLDSNKPIVHNNTNMILDEKATRFLSEISSIMIEYKQSIINFYGEEYSSNLKNQLWGVSIDKSYGGVNVNPSFLNMLAINPFYNFPNNPKIDAVNYIAVALDHLIIHELNHNFQRNEGAGFTGRFLTTYSEIHSLPNYFELISKLKLSIKNNLETIKKLNYEYEQSENVESGFEGNRIEDNNQKRADNGIKSISENDSKNNDRTDRNDKGSSNEFGEILNSNVETPTYNPETKSKTALLDEFNKLIEVSEKMGTKYPTDAITKIKSFLQDLNFNLSTVDEILAKRGLKDSPKAVIDFAYNTIAFADGATVEDFAEEIGHLIALHAPQDKNLDIALESIKDTQLYKDNYLNYVKTYSKPGLALEMSPERKAALEVLGRFYGKILTGTLTDKDLEVSKQSIFRRIMNAIRRKINKIDNFNLRNYLEQNRDNFFLEPGKEIKSKEIFYSLEQSENVAYNKMFNAIDNMISSMKSRMSREIKDTSAPLGEYSKRQANLQTQLALLNQMKENIAYDSAVADFLKSLYVDSANIFSFLEKYFVIKKEPQDITLKDVKFNQADKILVGDTIINNTSTNIKFDTFRIVRLKKDADFSTLHYSQLSELREFLMHYNGFIEELGIGNLTNDMLNDDKSDDLSELLNYVTVSLSSIEKALNLLNQKKMPAAIDELVDDAGIDIADIPDDIVAALKDTTIKGDVGMMEYLMGTSRDSSQPILRLFNATVKNIMHIAKRNTLSFAGKFLDKLNHRIGQSMDWAYERYNGKFTGYLISELNYGRFKQERDTFFKEINAKYEYPEDFNAKELMFNRIVVKFDNNNKYKEELKALKIQLNKELDVNKRTQLEEQIDTLNTLIDNVELDYRKLTSYQNEINRWFKDNTVTIDNVDEIIRSVIDDPELSSTEKNVWYNNNVNTNEDGDVMGYKNELVTPSDKYLNPDYKKLSTTDLEDLDYIKKTKAELDKFLPTKMNRLAPQTYQSAMDTFMKTQLPELVDKFKFLGKDLTTKKDDDEIGELVGDRVNYEDETRIIKYNPTRYTKMLLEPNNISTDLLSSMIAYSKMVSEFKEKAERIEQLEFISQNIKNGYTVDNNVSSPSNTSNLVKQMEKYLRVQIMGISYPDVTIPVLNIKPTKLLKNFARFVSLKNLGLNFVTQAVDFSTSKLWYHIETTMGDIVTRKSSKLGFAAFTQLAQDSIKESASTIKNNKLSAILRTLGLSDNLHSVFNDLDKNILMRDVTNKVLFAGYRASNFYVSGNAALSGMYNFRLYNGKWYTEREFGKIQNPTEQFDSLPSAYDNMRVENGLMSIDGMNTKTLNLFTRRMNNLISKIDGKLTEEDKTYAHSTLIGIVTLIHRDWILDGISRRLKKRGFNFDTSAVDEGYWISTARFMTNFFANKEKTKNLKFLIENYNELDDVQKEGVRRTMKELMVVVGSIALAIIMNLGDDDDDRELDYIRDMATYLATRSTVELTAFYNPLEYLYAATDVFVIGRDLKRIIAFTEMFDAREIESGKWEGWTRSQKYFLQNIPGVSGALSAANPEVSNRYIINNVLGFAGGFDKLKYYDVPLVGSIDEVELKEIERDKR
jgi:hypothetical protein